MSEAETVALFCKIVDTDFVIPDLSQKEKPYDKQDYCSVPYQ